MTVKLYILRHGETEWSLSGQHTGCTDIPLTAHGEEEARRLASRLRGIRFSAALCSPRQRAKRTCDLAGLSAVARVEPDSPSGIMAITRACQLPRLSRSGRGGTSSLTDVRTANCLTRYRRERIGSFKDSKRLKEAWLSFRMVTFLGSSQSGGLGCRQSAAND
jgi:bisphosphoglycerate-dependent phosphoglycerate mutase